MGPQKPPKVVLFDVGGVLVGPDLTSDLENFSLVNRIVQVLSPFQGIIDFERKNGITKDWINYAIRCTCFSVSMFLVLDQIRNLSNVLRTCIYRRVSRLNAVTELGNTDP